MDVVPEVLGADAVSVMHLEDPLPSYFEITAIINAGKPTGGYKSNAYLIFDYQSPTDFKFAGVNISIDKIQMGHRTVDGWIVDEQIPCQLKPDRDYYLLLALNGSEVFTRVYEPRVEYGYAFGLNAGMVGIGAYNSIARIDDATVQVLPPEITFTAEDTFEVGVSDLFTTETTGVWMASDGKYTGIPESGEDRAISRMDLLVAPASFLELEVRVQTGSVAGVVFDCYSPSDFKFAAISAVDNQLLIGHRTKGGWFVDATLDYQIEAGVDYNLRVSLKGTTVSLALVEDGENPHDLAVLGWAFNAVVVDGAFGLLAVEGEASFDRVTVKTDDPAFLEEGNNLLAAATAPQQPIGADVVLTNEQLAPITEEAKIRWIESGLLDDSVLSSLATVSFEIADLDGLALGHTNGALITIDVDAAGHGWFVDATPYDDEEFLPVDSSDLVLEAITGSKAAGRMDLLTVVMHELGHVLGFEHTGQEGVMAETLDAGVRCLLEEPVVPQTVVAFPTTTAGNSAYRSFLRLFESKSNPGVPTWFLKSRLRITKGSNLREYEPLKNLVL